MSESEKLWKSPLLMLPETGATVFVTDNEKILLGYWISESEFGDRWEVPSDNNFTVLKWAYKEDVFKAKKK